MLSTPTPFHYPFPIHRATLQIYQKSTSIIKPADRVSLRSGSQAPCLAPAEFAPKPDQDKPQDTTSCINPGGDHSLCRKEQSTLVKLRFSGLVVELSPCEGYNFAPKESKSPKAPYIPMDGAVHKAFLDY